MPDSGLADASVFTSALYTSLLRQQVVSTGVSGAHPTGATGRIVFDTDTDKLQIYNGAGWTWLGGVSAWDTFTPTWTNFTPGAATITALFMRAGRQITWYVNVLLSGSTVSGVIGVGTPVAASRVNQHPLWADLVDSGTSYPAMPVWGSTSRIDLYSIVGTGTYAFSDITSSIVPFTWGNGDSFLVGGVYEAATA